MSRKHGRIKKFKEFFNVKTNFIKKRKKGNLINKLHQKFMKEMYSFLAMSENINILVNILYQWEYLSMQYELIMNWLLGDQRYLFFWRMFRMETEFVYFVSKKI